MLRQMILYLMSLNIPNVHGSCSVTRVVMRMPHQNDIGLIFDLTVSNLKKDKSEVLELSVISNGECTLNLTNGQQLRAGALFGGDFGSIEPGNSITVSLVWPTVSLYNRVGNCGIVISSTNHQNEVVKTYQILYFDTRFETLDPSNHSLRRRKDFTNCNNWDKLYFQNCTPVNCEERYFGKLSFYNKSTQQCEAVPPCVGEGMVYDFYANECMDMHSFITDDEIDQLRQGKFDNNLLELQPYNSEPTNAPRSGHKNYRRRQATKSCDFKTQVSLVDFNNCFQHLEDPIEDIPQSDFGNSPRVIVKKKNTLKSIFTSFYYDWYMPLNKQNILWNVNGVKDGNNTDPPDESERNEINNNSSNQSDNLDTKITSGTLQLLAEHSALQWFIMTVQVLLIISLVIIFQILVTFLTYAVICVAIYTFLEILADLKTDKVTGSHISKELTPRDKHKSYDVMTSASLMSQLK